MPSASFQGMPGLFSGGDCASGPATVIKAIAAGKVMAANIDEYLGYSHTISCDIEIPIPNIDDRLACGRVELGEREASERIKDFEGVRFCMSKRKLVKNQIAVLNAITSDLVYLKEDGNDYGKLDYR